MKLLAITLKDSLRELRSAFTLFMALAAPLLVSGLMYLAFGGLGGGAQGRPAPTRLVVVDLDRPDPGSGIALGHVFQEHLAGLPDLVAASAMEDPTRARAAVDARKFDAALIIPEGFSAAAAGDGPAVQLTMYRDPTLTYGPSLLAALLESFLDGVLGARIAGRLAAESGGPAAAQTAAQEYVRWSQRVTGAELQAPAAQAKPAGGLEGIMRAIMTSMLLFFVFFTGGSAAQSIVREREEGTLSRLLATPTRPATILAGKALAAALILSAQVAVLLGASAVLFGLRWGRPGPLLLASGALVLAAAGFGLLLMSFLRTSRQGGIVLGVGLTVTGMLGGLFTNFIPGIPDLFQTVGLATPQGWAVRLWKLAVGGAPLSELAAPAAVLAGIGLVCYAAGVLLQRRRLA